MSSEYLPENPYPDDRHADLMAGHGVPLTVSDRPGLTATTIDRLMQEQFERGHSEGRADGLGDRHEAQHEAFERGVAMALALVEGGVGEEIDDLDAALKDVHPENESDDELLRDLGALRESLVKRREWATKRPTINVR